jgi:CelD/BcsL family acetyltransferase involved in cellulose biosynthesis
LSSSAEEVSLLDVGDLAAGELTEAWRDLAEARSNPFLTPEWLRSWLLAFGAEESAHVIVWRPGGELRGVLPLVCRRKGLVRELGFAGARRADWVTPACAPEDEAEMGRACARFLAGRTDWHVLSLDRLDDSSPWPTALREGGLAVAPPRRRDVLPFIEFDERGWDGYLADRSRNFRSQLGRRRRRLEREHGLRFRGTIAAADLDADLDEFLRLHDARWRDRGGSSSAGTATRRHLRQFAHSALERGWLRLWVAEADGSPAAAWYGWRIGVRYCYSLAGLDERYERDGLGTVLLAHTIEQAAGEGAQIYDLMWGDESYKKRFETGRRFASTWSVTRRRHPARLAVRAQVGAARAASRLPRRVREPLKTAAKAVRGG